MRQGINAFSRGHNNNEDIITGKQKSLLLRIIDAISFPWIGGKIEYVFAMIESGRQIIPSMNWVGGSGVTRANVSQTSLAIDSGATVHLFSNKELLEFINPIKK